MQCKTELGKVRQGKAVQIKVNPRHTLNDEEDAILIISIIAFASVADVDRVFVSSRGEEVVVVHE